MGLERPGTRAEQIAGQIFTLGRVQTVAEIVAQIDAVDAAAVKRYAARIMAAARHRGGGPGRASSNATIFSRALRARP